MRFLNTRRPGVMLQRKCSAAPWVVASGDRSASGGLRRDGERRLLGLRVQALARLVRDDHVQVALLRELSQASATVVRESRVVLVPVLRLGQPDPLIAEHQGRELSSIRSLHIHRGVACNGHFLLSDLSLWLT